MEIKGIVRQVFPVEVGTSKRTGMQWRSQGVVICHGSADSPADLYVTVRNQKIEELNLTAGKKGTFKVFVRSEVYKDRNGVDRWSTNVSLFGFEECEALPTIEPNAPAGSAPIEDPLGLSGNDGLGF